MVFVTRYHYPSWLRTSSTSFSIACISAITLANSGTWFATASMKHCCELRSDGGTNIPYHVIGSKERNFFRGLGRFWGVGALDAGFSEALSSSVCVSSTFESSGVGPSFRGVSSGGSFSACSSESVFIGSTVKVCLELSNPVSFAWSSASACEEVRNDLSSPHQRRFLNAVVPDSQTRRPLTPSV